MYIFVKFHAPSHLEATRIRIIWSFMDAMPVHVHILFSISIYHSLQTRAKPSQTSHVSAHARNGEHNQLPDLALGPSVAPVVGDLLNSRSCTTMRPKPRKAPQYVSLSPPRPAWQPRTRTVRQARTPRKDVRTRHCQRSKEDTTPPHTPSHPTPPPANVLQTEEHAPDSRVCSLQPGRLAGIPS